VRHVHRSDPSSNALKNLASLKHVAIFSVDSIEATYSVDNFEFKDEDNSDIKVEPSKLSILISNGSQKFKWDLWICERLGKVLGVSKDKLLSIILQDVEAMEEWFSSESIPEIDDHSSSDRSWLRDANTSSSDDSLLVNNAWREDTNAESSSFSHQPTNGSKSGRGKRRKSSNGNARAPTLDLDDEISTTMAAMSQLSISSGQIQVANRQNSDSSSQLSSATKFVSISPSSMSFIQSQSLGSKAMSTGKRIYSSTVAHTAHSKGETQETLYEQQNGVLGEYWVSSTTTCLVFVIGLPTGAQAYNYFLEKLPGFGPDNWTSELRCYAPGMTPYEGSSVLDFIYHDNEGILTKLWLGEDKMEEWRDQWPAYHVEVKGTSGTAQEAFHISRRQLEIVSIISFLELSRSIILTHMKTGLAPQYPESGKYPRRNIRTTACLWSAHINSLIHSICGPTPIFLRRRVANCERCRRYWK
jgi:hypothetical protein